MLSLFDDPSERVFHDDWEGLAARSVALLRTTAEARTGRHPAATRWSQRALPRSALFREFWERHDVRRIGDGVHLLHHPLVGELRLTFLRLPLVGTDGQSLFLYYAEPGSPSAAAMERLAGVGGDQQGHAASAPDGLASRPWTSI